MSDAELASLVHDDDARAFREIEKRYGAKIFRLLLNGTRNIDDANDLAQEAKTDAWLDLRGGHYHESGLFEHWLMGIARHRLDRFFRDKKLTRLFLSIDEFDFPDTTTKGEYREFLLRLGYALRHMSQQYRLSVILHFFKGKTFREIGERFGVKTNSASHYCSKAMEQIRIVFGVEK